MTRPAPIGGPLPTCRLLLAALIAAGPLAAAIPTDDTGTLWLAFDNDVVFNEDDDYTNGGLLGWVSSSAPSWRTVPGFGWAAPAFRRLPGMQRGDRWKAVSIDLAHLMFTPENIGSEQIPADERPFAGVAYLSLAAHQYDRRHLDSVDLLVGMVGPSTGAEEAQKFVHRIIDTTDPEGWDQQIGNELLVNLGYEHRWRALEIGDIYQHFGTDVIVGGGAMLGNLRTSAHVDLQWRIGYRVHSGFGNTSLNPISSGRLTPGLNGEPWGCYLGLGMSGETVAHDITLDGRVFADDEVTVDSEPAVAQAFVAIGGHIDDVQFGFQAVASSPTFEDEDDPPVYGRFLIGCSF